MQYHHEAVIEGKGTFPLDMLRYDQCYPATAEDSDTIERLMEPGGASTGVWTVNVRAYSRVKDHWTPERWRSFGVELVNDHTVKA